MNNKILTIITVITLIFSAGCEDYLDVNKDPNVLSDIPDSKALLPGAQIGIGNQLMGWDFGFAGAYWVQYWTQNYTASQFKALCEYRETSFEDTYEELTAGVLNDLKRIKMMSDNDQGRGKYFVAEALSLFTWQIVTDVWGDVPYFEALRGSEGIDSPEFDAQKEIYADLISRINTLLEMDLTDASLDGHFDFIFSGDLSKWRLFANSLKLKLMLRLSETEGYNNAEVLSFVENNEFLTSESAKIDESTWDDGQEGKRHPMREFEAGGASNLSTNVIGCKTFVDYLQQNADPRLNTVFSPAGGGFEGAFFGDFDSKEDSDADGTIDEEEAYCEADFAGDMDLILMSAWEVNFNIAEVYVRAGENEMAGDYYEAGVMSSLEQHGISNTEILEENSDNEEVNPGYAMWHDMEKEEGIRQIAMQRWVASANYQHLEAFLERNRNKYPSVNDINIAADRQYANNNFPVGQLTVSVNGRAKTNGQLPASPIYPSDVLTRNVNAPGQKTDLLEKVWWNQKTDK
ncbi:SusD/RagB family nutrient-binding outer membrane lipoprotein [Marinilabilia rubra]|uniref:SusD/RagB family nutrient-binding outer membrane lipoprotein n=1 Tax=Marinilabilia rubra TaxID=2162893 RepID=A0A2U2B3E7_9BACT|nr:SusD/RagB family nutrient-binding outer membrane lipoprotein [Marinilabilia rubra]PWD97557.1 SusD/RagB family nutrient-binding outer membrane lipoprotein [Marinilabilia rubra]